MKTPMTVAVLGTLLAAIAGCSGGDNGPKTAAPLCEEIQGADPKALFTSAIIPTTSVEQSLIFGGMDPGTLEPINYELGFRLNATNVPVTAPADLYVEFVEITNYTEGWRAGESDYGMGFHVCSTDFGEKEAAVEGDFAHMSSLSAELLEELEGDLECDTTDIGEETVESCSARFAPGKVVIESGTLIGSAGGTGLSAYEPGLDFNLLDTRYPVPYANPDRLGGNEGSMARYFRYGACVYEYFTEPTKAGYLSMVGQNGTPRVHPDYPCGTLNIDEPDSAGGIWVLEESADLTLNDDWIGLLTSLLVVGPHPVYPTTHEVVSTEMADLASWEQGGLLVEYEPQGVGDVNRSVYDMVPGTTYCIDGTGYMHPEEEEHYYVELGANAATLTIENVGASCAGTPEANRTFTAAAKTFVR